MNLISNEKNKVEFECKQYHQSKMESKLLGAQIQNLNEKLDCLRSLFEPRENSFINYEYKFNDVFDKIESTMENFGRFKVSNTYPPLCTARVLENLNNLPSALRCCFNGATNEANKSKANFFLNSSNQGVLFGSCQTKHLIKIIYFISVLI
jgi:hypothetical protein